MTNDKVVLTQEQAAAIENFLNMNNGDKAKLLNNHAQSSKWHMERYEAMNDLDQSDMARALLIGYEVKQKYEVGQWVAKADGTKFNSGYIAAEIDSVGYKLRLNGQHGTFSYDFLRHATSEEIKAEKERRLWAKLGRKVGEFKIGDVGIIRGSTYHRTANIVDAYKNGILDGFHPVETLISFKDGDEE